MEAWTKHRGTVQAISIPQLQWEAHIVEYVNTLYNQTKIHGNAKNKTAPVLGKNIPLLGPRFVPPTYLHLRKRQVAPNIGPETAYLKPLNIIHPFYYPSLSRCPQCGSLDVLWDGWTTTGHRELHGVYVEETALGYQLQCKDCKKEHSKSKTINRTGDDGNFCFATTNPAFWKHPEHWEVPRKSFRAHQRTLLTARLQVEFRTSSSAAVLQEIYSIWWLNFAPHKLQLV